MKRRQTEKRSLWLCIAKGLECCWALLICHDSERIPGGQCRISPVDLGPTKEDERRLDLDSAAYISNESRLKVTRGPKKSEAAER
jgi:hypothetical protein